jgi:hypothetical protein
MPGEIEASSMSLKIGQGENAKTTEPATKMPRDSGAFLEGLFQSFHCRKAVAY